MTGLRLVVPRLSAMNTNAGNVEHPFGQNWTFIIECHDRSRSITAQPTSSLFATVATRHYT